MQPHRWQPTRLPRPWDSPGKNTGVGCHFLLQCMKVKSESEVTQLCPTLRDPMDCSLPGSSVRGIFQAKVLEWGAIAFSTVSPTHTLFFFFFFFFGHMACRILVPRPGIKPLPPALEAQSLNHWTAREVPYTFLRFSLSFCMPGLSQALRYSTELNTKSLPLGADLSSEGGCLG